MDTGRGTPPPQGEPAVLVGGPYDGVAYTTMPGIHRIAVQVGEGGDRPEIWYERTFSYQGGRRIYLHTPTTAAAGQRG